MTEAQFQKQVIQLAHLHGWRVAHFRAVRVQRKNGAIYHATPVQADGAGFPDLVLVKGERLLFAELKVGGNQLSDEQRSWLDALAEAGQWHFVWRPEGWKGIEKELRE